MPQVSVLRITWWLLHFQILRPISRKVRAKGLIPRQLCLLHGKGCSTLHHWPELSPMATPGRRYLRKVSVQHSGLFKRASEKSRGNEAKWVKSCWYLQTVLFLTKNGFTYLAPHWDHFVQFIKSRILVGVIKGPLHFILIFPESSGEPYNPTLLLSVEAGYPLVGVGDPLLHWCLRATPTGGWVIVTCMELDLWISKVPVSLTQSWKTGSWGFSKASVQSVYSTVELGPV